MCSRLNPDDKVSCDRHSGYNVLFTFRKRLDLDLLKKTEATGVSFIIAQILSVKTVSTVQLRLLCDKHAMR